MRLGTVIDRTHRALVVGGILLAPSLLPAATNLVANGSFDAPGNALQAWQTVYTNKGESWYQDNPKRVSVVAQDGPRSGVLRLHGSEAILNVPGQGVKVDSRPIPLVLDGTRPYRFSAWARSTGPCCRILLEGYYWRKKVTPHDDPTLYELQKCYKFTQLYFGKEQAGDLSPVPGQWTQASQVFPEPPRSDIAKRCLEQVQFVVVHVIAIAGHEGDLFVDDIRLEPLPTPTGSPLPVSATSGAPRHP